jgi:hypothetical protein
VVANHLEQLVAEWCEFNGYFVRRNVHVGKRAKGGYDCELDVVAFNPLSKHLVHVEPSLDALSWEKRERRYSKKFKAGRKYIPKLFRWLDVSVPIDQVAVLVFASKASRDRIGGGRIMLVPEVLREITDDLGQRRVANRAVPEGFPLLRMIQFVAQYQAELFRGRSSSERERMCRLLPSGSGSMDEYAPPIGRSTSARRSSRQAK